MPALVRKKLEKRTCGKRFLQRFLGLGSGAFHDCGL